MPENIINLANHKLKLEQLKKELNKERDNLKRKMMDSIFSWRDFKLDAMIKSQERMDALCSELDAAELDDKKISEKRLQEIENFTLGHLENTVRIAFLFHLVMALQNEGSDWRTGVPSLEKYQNLLAYMDEVLQNHKD